LTDNKYWLRCRSQLVKQKMAELELIEKA